MEGGGAFGAGKATGQFDPIAFAKKPQVIVRALSWLFAIIVFGCISSQGYFENRCRYNDDPNACNFGVTIGVLAFLGVMVFLILDALFDNISSIQQRKYVVIGDIAFSGAWTFLYFVNFCYLTDAWRKTTDSELKGAGKSGVEAAIAFSFFSIGTFAGSTVLAGMRYRSGITEEFAQSGQPGFPGDGSGQQSAYPSYPSADHSAADPYQQQQQQQQQQGGFQGQQGGFQGQQAGFQGQQGGFQGQQGGFQGQQGGFQGQPGGGFQQQPQDQKMPQGDFQPPTY